VAVPVAVDSAVVIWDHHLQEEVGDGEEVILMAVDLAAWVVLCLFFWQQQD
jgi:hypothetical protein